MSSLLFKHRFLSMLVMVLSATPSTGQTTIKGSIKDSHKQPVEGVNIIILKTYAGCISDSLGNFSMTTDLRGTYTLLFSSLGHKEMEKTVEFVGEVLLMEIILKEEISELKAVTITAGSFEASDRKRGTIFNTIDIVSTASAEGDINGAMRSLPGVQQIGESGDLFVRGGTGKETKVFIDGMLVNSPNFSGAQNVGVTQRSRFSPFLFKGSVFSSGGFSALYGNAMSAALILETNDLPANSELAIGSSNTGINLGLQKLATIKTSSWGLTMDYSNLAPMFRLLGTTGVEFITAPLNYSLEGNYRLKTRNGGLLKIYASAGTSSTSTSTPHILDEDASEFFSITNSNFYFNITSRRNLLNKWALYIGSSIGLNTDRIAIDSLYRNNSTEKIIIKQRANLLQTKIIVTKQLGGLSAIRFGGELLKGYDYYKVENYFRNIQQDWQPVFFAETDIYISAGLAAKLGSRLEYSSLLGKLNYAPRISLAYKISDKSQFSLAYGHFYQKPGTEHSSLEPNLDFTRAAHLIANFQHNSDKQVLRTEFFLKSYHNLVTTVPAIGNDGSGYATGVEIFWRDKKSIENVDYWVSWSFLNTRRQYLDFPRPVQPGFAAAHSATLVYKHMIKSIKTNVGFSYAYASGRPYFNPNLPPEKFMTDRTNDYHSLSVNTNYLATIHKTFMVIVLSVSNVLGNKQVFGYHYLGYRVNNVFERDPIIPPVKRFLFAGIFFNIGVDRRRAIINNL